MTCIHVFKLLKAVNHTLNGIIDKSHSYRWQ